VIFFIIFVKKVTILSMKEPIVKSIYFEMLALVVTLLPPLSQPLHVFVCVWSLVFGFMENIFGQLEKKAKEMQFLVIVLDPKWQVLLGVQKICEWSWSGRFVMTLGGRFVMTLGGRFVNQPGPKDVWTILGRRLLNNPYQ